MSEKKKLQNKHKNPETWELRLYVAGQTPNSMKAFANLKKIAKNISKANIQSKLLTFVKNPQLAAGDQILAIPTLVRKLPEPIRKIIGDLSNTERVLVGLDIRPKSST